MKIGILITLLFLSGTVSSFGQTSCIQPMEDVIPALRWLNNRDVDGVELPLVKPERPIHILDSLEIPPQRPICRWGLD